MSRTWRAPAAAQRCAAVQAQGQEHIRLDRCDPCRLTFFDAGEMTDLRYDTLADTVRALVRQDPRSLTRAAAQMPAARTRK